MIKIIELAGPYPSPGFNFPKYNPKPNFPMSNRNAVTIEPIQTCFHFIFASGKNLNINANKTVRIIKDKTILTNCSATKNVSEKLTR